MFLSAFLLALTTPAELKQKYEEASGQIDNWLASKENSSDWSDKDREKSSVALKLQISIWSFCLTKNRDLNRNSREPIEIIVTAIIGSCRADQQKTDRLYRMAFRGVLEPTARQNAAKAFIKSSRESYREAITTYLFNHRKK